MKIKIKDRRILLYYIVNIFITLNMMIILFTSIVMLKSGETRTTGVINFFLNTLFFTAITKGILSLIIRINKKHQITLLLMSLVLAIFVLIMSILTSIFNPQIILQLVLVFWGVYAILYNYIILKNIRQYIPLVVIASIYAFFTGALLILMFIDMYKVMFVYNAILSGIMSITIVFISLEMLQLLAYVFIPEYYSKSSEIIDIFDEIKLKFEVRIRNEEEREELKNKKILERKMIERQRKAEREREKEERKLKRKNLQGKIKPLTKDNLNKYLENIKNKKGDE